MIEKVLQPKNLTKAYRKVVGNKGSAGVDKMTVGKLKAHIARHGNHLIGSILNRKYVPKPIRGVEIQKGKDKTRLLGIPTVVDRWLQQAVSQQLSAKFELHFEDNSYGFRPKRSLHQAVRQSRKYINDGYRDIVDIDLKGFFDEVDHSKLLQLVYNKVKCPITLRLIRKWLRAPILIDGKLYKRRKGIPQGGPISPLLSNIMLDELDKELGHRGLPYVRYADDFSIYAKTKAEARQIGNEVFLYLKEKLSLPINREKSGIRRPETFNILGYSFVPTYRKGDKGKYQLVVNKKGWAELKRSLKTITRKTKPYSFAERLQRLASKWKGWVNNYRLASIHGKLKTLDEWLRNRLRYCIWHDWKKMDRKRKNLVRMGVGKSQAYAWSRTRMGGWAVAQSPILRTTITLSRLRRKGYESMLDYYLKSLPQIR